jgi:hypothetical protein
MTRRKEAWFALIAVVGTTALLLGLAEVALRFMPVASAMRAQAVNAENPVYHFAPNRDFVYSRGWNFALFNRGHVNNAGFVNDQDYRKEDASPLLAVIGDSYIEALMVPYAETVHGRLAKAREGRLRVYSFGASGAPLSQYLVWARHAVKDYGASRLLINVVGNDFDESLAAYRTGHGFWHYVSDANNELKLRLFEYRPTVLGKIAAASALGRYLVFNLEIGQRWLELRALLFGGPALAAPRYAGNTSTDTSEPRMRDSLAGIEAFFRDLPELVGLPPDRVLFTLDGLRYPGLAAAAAGTYFDLMRRAFRRKAESLGYDVIDLDDVFFEHYRRTGELFEFPGDAHWSGVGHRVVFDAVLASRFFSRIGESQGSVAASGRME